MFNYIWRDKISLNLEIMHVTFSPEPSFHPHFFLCLYYMCQALPKRFSGITSFIPWMITIPVFLQGLGNLFPGMCWGELDLRQRLQDPHPHLLYRQTPDNDQSSPSLELHIPSSTDAGQSTRLPHKHFKSNSSKPEIFPFFFPQISSFPVPPLLPWWEWALVDCQQSDHLNSGSTEHLLLACFHPPCIWPTVQLENPNLIPTCVLSSNLAPPNSPHRVLPQCLRANSHSQTPRA